jgi:hypothetical protein
MGVILVVSNIFHMPYLVGDDINEAVAAGGRFVFTQYGGKTSHLYFSLSSGVLFLWQKVRVWFCHGLG